LKPKHQKIGDYGERSESALGEMDRRIIFMGLQVGHLPKEQVAASDEPASIEAWWRSLVETCGIPILSFDYTPPLASVASDEHPSDFKRVASGKPLSDHLHWADEAPDLMSANCLGIVATGCENRQELLRSFRLQP
jgi:hypothetical protein